MDIAIAGMRNDDGALEDSNAVHSIYRLPLKSWHNYAPVAPLLYILHVTQRTDTVSAAKVLLT